MRLALRAVPTVAAAAAVICTAFALSPAASASQHPKDVTLPPVHVGFDYQIGSPYTPPAGVRVVSRDHSASPAAGLYNICYVNAFQAQSGEENTWDSDLLLRDSKGNVVKDPDWNEALLDISTSAKRQRIAAKVDGWIDGCANKGFQAVEPDNYDSYSRSKGLLNTSEAQSYIQLLSAHSHADGLAIAQKNTAELAGSGPANGLDFAIAEECGTYSECDAYASAFDNRVFVIEYTDDGLAAACAGWGSTLSIVERDLDVSAPGDSGYVRKTC